MIKDLTQAILDYAHIESNTLQKLDEWQEYLDNHCAEMYDRMKNSIERIKNMNEDMYADYYELCDKYDAPWRLWLYRLRYRFNLWLHRKDMTKQLPVHDGRLR